MPFDAKAVMAEIRRRDPELAVAIDREEAEDEWRMPDELLARLDAWLTGTGFMVSGRRVDPSRVTIVKVPGDE